MFGQPGASASYGAGAAGYNQASMYGTGVDPTGRSGWIQSNTASATPTAATGGTGAPAGTAVGPYGAPPLRTYPDPTGVAQNAYGDYLQPGLDRARDLLLSGYGYGAPGTTGIAPLTTTMQNAVNGMHKIARRNLSGSMGTQGAKQMQQLAGSDGLTAGSAAPLSTLADIGSGQDRITTENLFRNVRSNPLSGAQERAASSYRGIVNGDGDISSATSDQIAGYGLNSRMRNAGNEYGAARSGQRDVSTQALAELNEAVGERSFAQRNLRDIANGEASNEYLSSIIDQIGNQARRAASAAGRGYGSGYEAGQTSEAIARVMFDQHNSDIANQLAATGQLDAERARQQNLQASLGTTIAGLEGQNYDRRMAGAQALQGLGQADTTNRLAGEAQAAGIQGANRAAQLEGAAGLAGIGQQRIANRLAANQALTDVQATNIANRGNAAQAELSARDAGTQQALRAQALMPELLASRYADTAQRISAATQAQQRADLRQSQRRSDSVLEQQAPYDQLMAYMSALNGGSGIIGSNLGIQGQMAAIDAQQPNQLAQTLGLVGTGVGLANQTGLLQPFTSAAGSGLGALGNAAGSGLSAIGTAIGSLFG